MPNPNRPLTPAEEAMHKNQGEAIRAALAAEKKEKQEQAKKAEKAEKAK